MSSSATVCETQPMVVSEELAAAVEGVLSGDMTASLNGGGAYMRHVPEAVTTLRKVWRAHQKAAGIPPGTLGLVSVGNKAGGEVQQRSVFEATAGVQVRDRADVDEQLDNAEAEDGVWPTEAKEDWSHRSQEIMGLVYTHAGQVLRGALADAAKTVQELQEVLREAELEGFGPSLGNERAAFEEWIRREAGPGATKRWIGTSSYENERVQDNRLGWAQAIEWVMLSGGPGSTSEVPFFNRSAVERALASAGQRGGGMQLNDGKERVVLPGGTLQRMLKVIDTLCKQGQSK